MKVCIYFGVFFSSMIGAQVWGISLNKIALIPLEVWLLIKVLLRKDKSIKINKRKAILILWYLVCALSSMIGILFADDVAQRYVNDVYKKNLFQIIQIVFMYIPISILLPRVEKNTDIIDIIKKALIITVRIQAIWALLQLTLYYTIKFDLNNWFFIQIMGNSDTTWTLRNNIGGVILLRPSGLNHDVAFLGILLIVGLIIDKLLVWKSIYLLTILMTFSRSAFVTAGVLLGYRVIKKIPKEKIKLKSLLKVNIAFILICTILFVLYKQVPFINSQISRMIERMSMISTGADGTSKHTNYPLVALEIFLFYMPIYTKMFGIGMPVSGVAFNTYSSYITAFSLGVGYIDRIWTIECDFATVLIGTGGVGFFVYYYNFVKTFKATLDENLKEMIVCMMIYGIMYNIAGITITQFILWMFVLDSVTTVQNKKELDCIGY